MRQRYLVALGSNRRHPRHGTPRAVIAAAARALADAGVRVRGLSPVMASRPLGPSDRLYANAVADIDTALDPPDLLALLHRIEAAFGRRRRGQPWGARVLDLDIVLWDGGCWAEPGLIVPHVQWRERLFVVGPAVKVVPGWRDPLCGQTVRHLHVRLTRPRALPKRQTIRSRYRAGP